MSSSSNTIKMNDSKCSSSIAMELWPYYPHSSVLIWITQRDEPLNKGARVILPIIDKRKKKPDAADHQTFHRTLSCTCLNKDSVISRVLIIPIWVRMNPFLIHATCATEVTGCEKSGNCRMVHQNTSINSRTLIKGDIIR